MSIPTERHRTVDENFGKHVLTGRRIDPDIRPFEEFLLNRGRFSAMETDFRLIEQPRAERISMSNREVPQSIVRQPRIPWGRWATKIRGWQWLVLCAVGIEEASGKLALVALQVIYIDDKLILIKFSGNTKRRESSQCERFRRIDCLRRRHGIPPVWQLQVQDCERGRADVRPIGRHRHASLGSCLARE